MRDGRVELTALLVGDPSDESGPLSTDLGQIDATPIRGKWEHRVSQYSFSLPARSDAWYAVDGERYEVNAAFDGDLRVAYVACNGQEHGDLDRPITERNALWRRLCQQHDEQPFQLLLHGGDQVYADEVLEAHPRLRQWDQGQIDGVGEEIGPDGPVTQALRRAYFKRYVEVLGQPEIAWLMARVPSLAMWDDHDICDGWGSLPVRMLDAPVGRRLFESAREHFLLFQLGVAPGTTPAACPDRSGTSLCWHHRLPGLHVIAPDLRSERRPDRVMGTPGWEALETALGQIREERVLLMSSVPALGPRLSWLEALMHLTPWMEKYEDDLRDQWQSRAHRNEWRAFLERLAEVHARAGVSVTVLSGEIHLATRGTLHVPPAPVHQLVASGIAHPPAPRIYARTLGALARLGEAPLPGHPIRLHPLPGKKAIYTAQRNYLVLERTAGSWHAWWELEQDGPTACIAL